MYLLILFYKEVNAGPLAIAKTFLGENRSKYDPKDITRLEEAMKLFISACKEALQLNKTIISADQKQFQELMEEGFANLSSEFDKLLN